MNDSDVLCTICGEFVPREDADYYGDCYACLDREAAEKEEAEAPVLVSEASHVE